MQRRQFLQSTASLAMLSAIPINFFSQNHEEKKGLVQGLTKKTLRLLAQPQTQTTTVKCKGQAVKIHAIQTGMVAVKQSHRTNRTWHFLTPLKISLDKQFTELMPIWAWAIEHPEGVMIIDTGENAAVMQPDYFKPAGKLVAKYSKKNFKFEVSKENEIGYQLAQLGIEQDRIKNVVLTHLHVDHTDGIKDFPQVEILLSAAEYKRPSGHFPELLPNWFKPKTVSYKDDFVDIFQQAYPLTDAEDMLLVPTPGHTRHHASVLFKTDDFDILFAGDVCYYQAQLQNGDLPGINVSYRKSRKTYQKIASYAEQRDLIFLPTHDPDAAYRLQHREYLR